MISHDADLAIVGAGFGGSILAMIARRLGLRVMLLERGRHPRFAIGESASPLAGILIEQLSDRYDLPRVRPLSAFGTWQRACPRVVCGLKRGFSYFRHELGQPYRVAPDRANQLLVAASPSDELSDTHWLRSDVDHFLVAEATAAGVEYLDLARLDRVEWSPGGDPVLLGTRDGRPLRVLARFVVDASGPGGFLSRALGIADQGFDGYPGTQALFSHFVDVDRCDQMEEYEVRGSEGEATRPPYPIDDAALHHVFDGGWMWVLRFGNGVTSAGIAVEDWLASDLRLGDGAPAWERFLGRYPSVAAQFARARPIREFTRMARLSYRASHACGERWAMLPSASAFVDPLFSTGIPLTLLGIERFARILERQGAAVSGAGGDLAAYGRATLEDADRTARFIGGSYPGFRRFEQFSAWSMFYFAAASFSEMARRLASSRTPHAFLCGDSPDFVSALDALSPVTWTGGANGGDRAGYAARVARAIEPWNVAGLADPGKRNWYGVDLEDTVRAAARLALTPGQVRERLCVTDSSGAVRSGRG